MTWLAAESESVFTGQRHTPQAAADAAVGDQFNRPADKVEAKSQPIA